MLSSLTIIISHILFLHLLRKSIHKTSLLSEPVKSILLAGVCAFELGCVCLEQGVLLDHYGYFFWAVSLVLVVAWQVVGWQGVSPNALPYILERSLVGALQTLAMLICGLLSYKHMQMVWEAEVSSLHKGRALATSSQVCQLPWSNLSLYKVLLCELVGSFLLSLLPRYLIEHETLANNDPTKVYRGTLVGFTVLTVVSLGMNTSGAMYNPTLATLLLGGCKGYSWLQHFFIYWLTPLFGALMATFVTLPSDRPKKKIA